MLIVQTCTTTNAREKVENNNVLIHKVKLTFSTKQIIITYMYTNSTVNEWTNVATNSTQTVVAKVFKDYELALHKSILC